MSDNLRSCWQNCIAPDDKSFLDDKELVAIEAMEDSISPLDEETVCIRQLITRFEPCYHEADKEAERIIRAIGSGQPPVESNERPPQRKQELQNSHDILSVWCEGDFVKCADLDVGGILADELVAYLGESSPLKIWQVQRMIEQLKQALERSCSYHDMELDIDGYGQPLAVKGCDYYKDQLDFLNQTTGAKIKYVLGGEKSEMSLALAIDLFRPCNWNYVRNLVVILKAIGGDLRPNEPFAPCCLNANLTPLREGLMIISNTLKMFCGSAGEEEDVDSELLDVLGDRTDVKRWLAASLDKTLRLQLTFK